jgi:hypothetical protein
LKEAAIILTLNPVARERQPGMDLATTVVERVTLRATEGPKVIVAAMAIGIAIAAIGWYHRRLRFSTLERVLVGAGIGLAFGAAVVSVVKENIERQRRVADVGGRSIVLVAPPGFVMIGPERPELWKAFEVGAPENGRRIVALIPERAYKLLAAGQYISSIERVLAVDVTRRLEYRRLTPADFAQEKEKVRKFIGLLLAAPQAQLPELYPKLEESIERPLSETERASLIETNQLPVHRDTERLLAFSIFRKEKQESGDHVIWAVTSNMVLVGNVVIYISVIGNERELEWTRLISEQWADAVLAANAH